MNQRVLVSFISLLILVSVTIGATSAYFSDIEQSSNNQLNAGKVDLLIGNLSYYNQQTSSNPIESWDSKNLTDEKFLNLSDIKPADFGVNLIDLKVDDNDSWACMYYRNLISSENSCTEPEVDAEQALDSICVEGGPDGPWGDLHLNLEVMAWLDDGDKVWDESEIVIYREKNDLQDNVFNPYYIYSIADSLTDNGPLIGNQDYDLGMIWCLGDLSFDDDRNVICDGSNVGNSSQTDSMKIDLSFYAEQSRNNSAFKCSDLLTTLETFQVTSMAPEVVQSNTILESGKTYLIEATGTYTFAPGGRLADAEFWYDPDTDNWNEEIEVTPEELNLELLVNNLPQDWLGSTDGINYTPHTFSPDHTYRLFVVGNDQPLDFFIYVSTYDWKDGYLTVKIKSY